MSPPPAAAPAVRPRRIVERPGIAPGRPRTAPPRPRRVSGPARRPITDRPARRRSQGQRSIAVGLIGTLERLSQHQLLDRLTARRSASGRTWIAVVAFALIGIVTLQLVLLKLNAGIGRALEHEALLQRENATLSAENSEMAAGDRVQARASQLGMAFVPSGALRFLAARPRIDAARSAQALSTPAHTSTTGGGEALLAGSGTGASASPAPATAEGQTTASSSPSSAGSPGTGSTESKTPAAESTTAAAPPKTAAESTTAAEPRTSGTAPAGGSSAESAPAPQSQASPAAGGTNTGPTG